MKIPVAVLLSCVLATVVAADGLDVERNQDLEVQDPDKIPYAPPAPGYVCARYAGYAHGMRFFTAAPGEPWILRHTTQWPDACWDHSAVAAEPLIAIDVRTYITTDDGAVLELRLHGDGWGI